MSQLIPLPLTVSCFSKIHIDFTFLVLAHLDNPGKTGVKRVCVCVIILFTVDFTVYVKSQQTYKMYSQTCSSG